MISMLRIVLLMGILLAVLQSVQATSLLALPASEETLACGEIRPISTVRYLGWDGRALGSADIGAAAGVTDTLTVGLVRRDTTGHGSMGTRHYDAGGWQGWGEWQPLRAAEAHPGIALRIEHSEERIHLFSADATSSYTADPGFSSTGGQLSLIMRHRGIKITAYAGAHVATLNSSEVATIQSIGGRLAIPLGRRHSLESNLVGYRDNYQGRHVSYQTSVALHTVSSHMNIAVECSLFPCGIPLAGTPLSAASTVGVIYGDSASAQLRTRAIGYISISGEYRF